MDVVRISGRNPNGNDKLETMEPSWERQINDGKTSAEVTAERSFVFFLPAHLHNLKIRLQIPPHPPQTHTHTYTKWHQDTETANKKNTYEKGKERCTRARGRAAHPRKRKKSDNGARIDATKEWWNSIFFFFLRVFRFVSCGAASEYVRR